MLSPEVSAILSISVLDSRVSNLRVSLVYGTQQKLRQ